MKRSYKKMKADADRRAKLDEGKEWKGELIHSTYDQLADGSRVKKRTKAVDPETASAIRRAFGVK
jgi:hypothetical protein